MFLGVSHARIPTGGAPASINFLGPLLTSKPFYLERQNLACPHMWGSSVFLWGPPRGPLSKGGGVPESPNFWDLLLTRAHSMKDNNQILHGDQTRVDVRKIFAGSTTRPNPDVRSAVANLLVQ